MAACFCLHLCDQNGQLVIRTWISNLGRTGFLLLTLTSEKLYANYSRNRCTVACHGTGEEMEAIKDLQAEIDMT